MTHFTVSPSLPRVQHVAAAGVIVYAFPFPIIDPEDIAVFVGSTLLDGGYVVLGLRQTSGGTVTLSAPVVPGEIITIIRARPIRRMTDFTDGGEFRANTVNDEMDSLTMVAQQLKEEIGRSIRIDPPFIGVDLRLPVPVPGRRALISNAAGTAFIYSAYDPDATVGLALDAANSAAEAADSAAAAAASAANAGSISERDFQFVLSAGVQGYGPLPIQPPLVANVSLFIGGQAQGPGTFELGDEHGAGLTIVLTAVVSDTPGPGELQAGLILFGKVIGGITEGAIGSKTIKERHLEDGIIDLAGRLIAHGPPNKQVVTNGAGVVIFDDFTPSVEWTNVIKYGALGVGTDDTDAINAAEAARPVGGVLYFPPGHSYGISGAGVSINKNGSVMGMTNGSKLVALDTTVEMLKITQQFTHVEGLLFDAASARQPGYAAIKITTGNQCRIKRCRFWHQTRSIWATPEFGATLTIEAAEIYDSLPGLDSCIQIDAGFDVSIIDTIIANVVTLMPVNGILITACGDAKISNSQVLCCQNGLNVFAAAGKVIASVTAGDSYFDNCGRGVSIGADQGAVVRSKFSDCWFGSAHTDHGFIAFTARGGRIDGVELTACEFVLNAQNGFIAFDTGVSNVQIIGGYAAGNGLSGLAFGVSTPVHDWTVTGLTSGESHGLGANQYGIFVVNGSDRYTAAFNNFHFNSIAASAGLVAVSTASQINFGNRF